LLFVFIYSVQALLNSTPQVLARDRRTVTQGLFRGAKFIVSSFWGQCRGESGFCIDLFAPDKQLLHQLVPLAVFFSASSMP